MSLAAAHESKHVRRVCQNCRDRKAKFRFRGQVRSYRNHTLCFECFRSARERQRALRLAEVPPASPLRVRALEARPLDSRQVAHRRLMLAHLASAQKTG